jgi:predicted MPP superfamily phosphohydrolase
MQIAIGSSDMDLGMAVPRKRITIRRAFWALALVVLVGLAMDAFWIEPCGIRTVHHEILLKRADAAQIGPLRIAVVGDLHAGAPFIDEAKIHRAVDLANAAQPDLILLAGDFVTNGMIGARHFPIERAAAILRKLHAPLGVYAVTGNHDHWENALHIAAALQGVGIPVLENRSVPIRRGGQTLYLVGIGDFFSNADNPKVALARVPAGQSALCLTHSPDVFPELPATCQLTIAAHTHGGQVWFPFFGRLIVPSKFGQRYAAGLVREHGKVLFVSTGIGTSIIPVRFGVPPEVSVLDIRIGNP